MPHATLSIRLNVVLVLAWAVVAAISIRLGAPQSYLVASVGAVAGLVTGTLQRHSIRLAPDRFAQADSALAVRRALVSNRPGKWAVAMVWVTATVLAGLTVWRGGQLLPVFASGYTSFMFVREATSLSAVQDLGQDQSTDDPAF